MRLNDVWGYGQLFGYSAIDGLNKYDHDFIGTLTSKEICIRFEFKNWIKLCFKFDGKIAHKAIMSDFIESKTESGDFFITFADSDTLVGYSPVKPEFEGHLKVKMMKSSGVDVVYNNAKEDFLGVVSKETDGGFRFSIHHALSAEEAGNGAALHIDDDIEQLKQKRYEYYEQMPKCKDGRYEKLYYKALSINKVNVRSAEGNIPCTWTTPDRVPHRHMWLWDSVFHALAIVRYNGDLAKDAIWAVLSQQDEDGFISHMMNPHYKTDITQPQVLSWGVWEVYKKTGDKDYLKKCVDRLEKYLIWDMENRDKNKNCLLEWFTEPDYLECRCGESGLDNSPRFDVDEDLDAIDFSTFLCNDSKYLSLIYKELGNESKAKVWNDKYEFLKKEINELLWDEESGAYYDRTFSGKLTKVLTPMGFMPIFAGIPSKKQAQKMVEFLVDKNELWTSFPLASISKKEPTYSTDMWRGGVWLNINYLIMKGLKEYGYDKIAKELKNRTLSAVEKWYEKTGCIFEFYDSANRTSPFRCLRKGKPSKIPDWRKHVHSISDYNWSASFVILMIQEEDF